MPRLSRLVAWSVSPQSRISVVRVYECKYSQIFDDERTTDNKPATHFIWVSHISGLAARKRGTIMCERRDVDNEGATERGRAHPSNHRKCSGTETGELYGGKKAGQGITLVKTLVLIGSFASSDIFCFDRGSWVTDFVDISYTLDYLQGVRG